MGELSQPQVGQRCHVTGIGFGTIRKIEEREQEGLRTRVTTYLKIEFDAKITRWKPLSEVELLLWPSQKREEA